MNNNSGYDESCMDDGAWDSLFKMAENAEYESDFEGQAASEYDMPVYDNVAFQGNEPGKIGATGHRRRRCRHCSDMRRSDRGRRR